MTHTNINKVFTSDADGDLKKSWYIFYYCLNPHTGKKERFRETLGINRIQHPKERQEALIQAKIAKQILLDNGWSPYQKFDPDTFLKEAGLLFTTFEDAVNQVLAHKKLHLKPTSFVPLNSRSLSFLDYLQTAGLAGINVKAVSKKHVLAFLDEQTQQRNVSNRTRNNILTDIRTLFSTMMDMELVDSNPAARIKKLKTESVKNETYTDDEVIKIFDWMDKNDPQLSMFCSFIAFDFIRPVEITRLTVGDIDLVNKVITLPASKTKTGLSATIPMVDFMIPKLEKMNLHKYPKDYFLFSAQKCPNAIGTTRDYFTCHFAILKKELGFGINHTMYGLKHTFVCHLLEQGVPEGEIRRRTRHKTASAFNSYITKYNKQQHNDISDYFKLRP
jgi:integrase